MKYPSHFAVQPGWRLLIADMGIDVAHVLRLANLPADLFARPSATVTAAQYFHVWQALEQAAGDGMALPLRIGQAVSVEGFDPPIFASVCSPNLNVALQRLAKFKKLICPMTLQVDVGDSATSATLECFAGTGPVPRSMAATEVVFLTQLARLATRHRIVPMEVILPELPEQIEQYSAYFGIVPKRGNAIRVSFSNEDSTRQFLTASDAMWTFFEAGLRERLRDLDRAATMSERVKAVLLEGLPSGQFTVDEVAKNLAISKRTLQRQLSEEAATFKDVLNATRQQLAVHYLRKPGIAQGEIAYLLGFQDVNSFIRAFKDWQGMTPGAFREEARAEDCA